MAIKTKEVDEVSFRAMYLSTMADTLKIDSYKLDQLRKAVVTDPKAAKTIAIRFPREAAQLVTDLEEGTKLLHNVVMNKDPAAAIALVENNLKLMAETKDKDDWTVLHEAVEVHKTVAKKILEEHPEYLGIVDKYNGQMETVFDVIKREWQDLITPQNDAQAATRQ